MGSRGHALAWLAGLATLVALVGVVVLIKARSDTGAITNAWRLYPRAFEVEDSWMSGAQVLVPDPNGCFVAVGNDGLGSASWTASGDCSVPARAQVQRSLAGDSLPGDDRASIIDAVPAIGGGYLAIGRHRYFGDAFAYEGYALRGDPINGWRRVAAFETSTPKSSHIGPFALIRTAAGYVAVGQREQAAVAWTSSDGGTWRERPLPGIDGATSTTVVDVVEGGGRLVAIGSAASASAGMPASVAWVSSDGGATWRVARITEPGSPVYLRGVVYDGASFRAFGGARNDLHAPAYLATSTDGLDWHAAPEIPGARLLWSGVALPDGTVIVVSSTGDRASMPNEQCATAWVSDGAGWIAEKLGCHGVPTSLAVLSDGRVAAAHWGTLWLRDGSAA